MHEQPLSTRKKRLIEALPCLMEGDRSVMLEISDLYLEWLSDRLATQFGVESESVDYAATTALQCFFFTMSGKSEFSGDPEAYLKTIAKREYIKLVSAVQYCQVHMPIKRIITGNPVRIEVPDHGLNNNDTEIKVIRATVAPSLKGIYTTSGSKKSGGKKVSTRSFLVIDRDFLELDVSLETTCPQAGSCGYVSVKRKRPNVLSLSPPDEEATTLWQPEEGQRAESLTPSAPDSDELKKKLDPNYPGIPDLVEAARHLLIDGLLGLSIEERELLFEVIIKETPLQTIGDREGVSADAIRKRRDKALERAREAILRARVT